MVDKTDALVVDLVPDSTTIFSGAGYLYGWYVNTTLSAHACPILDGGVVKFTIPASAAAGTSVLFPIGVRFNALVVDPNDVATGNITLLFSRTN